MGSSAGGSKRGGECPANCKIVVLSLVMVLLSIEAGSVRAQAYGLGNWFNEVIFGSTLPLPSSPASSVYSGGRQAGQKFAMKGDAGKMKSVADLEEGELNERQNEALRRQLRRRVTYLSYGALTSGYTPCPPRSGRSYYTRRCKSATGAVRPYARGCSTIANCARS